MVAKKKVSAKKVVKKSPPAKRAAPKKNYGPFKLNEQSWNQREVMRHVCAALATSDKGLGQILDDGCNVAGVFWPLPGYSTIMEWLSADTTLSDNYARAREDQADWMQHDMLRKTMELAQQPLEVDGAPVMVNGKPLMVATQTGIQLARLYTDNMKWAMSKLKPKKYGEATLLKHANPDGNDLPPMMVMNFGGTPAKG